MTRAKPVKNRASNRPVWSDRPGEKWGSRQEAAAALGRSNNAVVACIYGHQRTCAGRRLYSEPPDWVAEAENRRVAAIRVRVPKGGRVHMGNGYGPDGRKYEPAEEKLKSADNSGTDSPGPAVEYKAGRPDAGNTEAALTDTQPRSGEVTHG